MMGGFGTRPYAGGDEIDEEPCRPSFGHYVGIPWRVYGRDHDGCDCWGLVRLVLREQFGIAAPSYVGGYAGAGREDVAEIARLIDGEMGGWEAIAPGSEEPGDVLLLRQWGRPCHVGVVIGGGRMLHIEEGVDAVAEPYDGPRWRRRVAGAYRWAPTSPRLRRAGAG